MRVLIADDQRDVGRALANLVRLCNHEVVEVVGSGLDAIQAYNRHHPDLVLMDYRMPKLNGGTACRNIVSKDPAARVILVTAWSPSDDAGASGAIAILPKPVDLERLKNTLQSIAPSPISPLPSTNSELPYPISDLLAPSFDLPTPSSELLAPSFALPSPSSELPAFSEVGPMPMQGQSNAGAARTSDLTPRTSPANGKNSRSNHRRRDNHA